MKTITHYAKLARISHICDYCKLPIAAKSMYNVSTHIHDKEFYTWRAHQHCAELSDRLRMLEDRDYGITADDFIEDVKIEFDNINIHENLVANTFEEILGHVLDYHKIN